MHVCGCGYVYVYVCIMYCNYVATALPNPLKLTGMYSTISEGNNSVFAVDFKYDNLSTSYDKYNYYDECRLDTWYQFQYCCSNNCTVGIPENVNNVYLIYTSIYSSIH